MRDRMMATEAEAWLESVDTLEREGATLEEVQKAVKAYAKISLLSSRIDGLKSRAAAGQAWLDECKATYKEKYKGETCRTCRIGEVGGDAAGLDEAALLSRTSNYD